MDRRPAHLAPRGKTLGGSSSINGHIYNRGQSHDFDNWAQFGNRGWGYQDVLPYFKRLERRIGEGDAAYRGREGSLTVTDIAWSHPLCDAFIEGAVSLGIPRNPDYNGAVQEGVSYAQRTIHKGRRVSAATAFLRPAMKRGNLDVRTHAHATAIVLDGKRATGVRRGRSLHRPGAARAVYPVRVLTGVHRRQPDQRGHPAAEARTGRGGGSSGLAVSSSPSGKRSAIIQKRALAFTVWTNSAPAGWLTPFVTAASTLTCSAPAPPSSASACRCRRPPGRVGHRRHRRPRSPGHARRHAGRLRTPDRRIRGLRRVPGRRCHRPHRLRPADRPPAGHRAAARPGAAARRRSLPPLPRRLPLPVT